jgi:sugar phosphate permease
MGILWRTPPADVGERARRRVIVYLIPYLFFLYILAYLDRVNVSVAGLGMGRPPSEEGLGLTPKILGFGAGIFFWGYWILEIPSTLSVLRWGARWVFVRILVLWGLACVFIGSIGTPWADRFLDWLTAPFFDRVFAGVDWLARLLPFVGDAGDLSNPTVRQFYFLRFLLGFFEGGFFPSVILYLSLWFRPRDRARAIATFMAAIPCSNLIGSPISAAMLKIDWFDLPGWRWIFILQGIVPILAGVATLFFLPDRPSTASWLRGEEQDWLLGELHREHLGKQAHGHFAWFGQAGLVLLLTGYYFCMNLTSYGLTLFMPMIIKSQSGLSDFWSGTLAALPYLLALGGMLLNGWHSDRTHERIGHTAVPLTCLSAGIYLAAWFDRSGFVPVLILIFLVGPFLYAHLPAFWPLPSTFLGAAAAASAIGFINMVGNLGGFVGPAMVGNLAKPEPNGEMQFGTALFRLAPFPLVSVAIILFVGYLRRDVLRQRR